MFANVIQVGSIGTNCYLFGDEDAGVCALVDPGDESARIIKAVKKTGYRLQAIFLTHGHQDHTGAAQAVKGAFPGVEVYLHDDDVEAARARGAFMPDVGVRTKSYGEGDVIALGGLSVKVLHTPGHTPGGVTLQVGDVLFTGDTLFRGSMGRTDFPGGSYPEILASLRRLAELPGDYQVCPGHEGLSTLERERKGNYYMREALNG
ncbi:MAG: MBL fold metallo-hydrolase [Clostridiales bacterium]|nr:MBL fold metallo-hydrolase [Clostridiales bacterium]